MTVVDYRRPKESGPEMYAPKRRAVGVDGDLRALESEIGKVVAVPGRQGSKMQSRSERAAADLNALIGRVSDASAEEIDRVILDLQGVHDMLRKEGKFVSREIARYVNLNHAVVSAMKVITDNLAQWKTRY